MVVGVQFKRAKRQVPVHPCRMVSPLVERVGRCEQQIWSVVKESHLDRDLHPDFGQQYGIPITVVSGSHKKVKVAFDYSDESDHARYPRTSTPASIARSTARRWASW